MKLVTSLAIATCVFSSCVNQNSLSMKTLNETKVVYLENEHVRVGILPDVGGRIVYLSVPGHKNLLKSDSSLWNEPQADRMPISAHADFKAYNGHIVWLGPQSDWWIYQEENIARKQDKSPWPPDPFLIYGNFVIDSISKDYIRMSGPESRFTGMQLTKEVKLLGKGKILFRVKGCNIRQTAVAWDLWLNTRMDGFSRCYVPVGEQNDIRINASRTSTQTDVKWSVVNGFFTYQPEIPVSPYLSMNSKAFIYPSQPMIAGFDEGQALIIRFEKHKQEAIHPEQALVEIYNHTASNREAALLELEYHSPYVNLEPGQETEAWQTWEVIEYKGDNTDEARTAFLGKLQEVN